MASGSTSSGWKKYLHDWTALNAIAGKHRTLMLSGDLHHNDFASHGGTAGLPLHEATASGAAVRDAVVYGHDIENFGLVELGADELRLRFFDRDHEASPRHIRRADWRLVEQA